MAKKTPTNIYFLIDRSGSMQPRWDEALGAVNGYMKTLGADKAMKGSSATVAVFDNSFDVVRDKQQIADWKDITNADASPRGMTPLFDAIGRLSAIVDKDAPAKAVIAVMTDGHENMSREVTREGAKALLDALRGKGFQVVFLGADFDAFGQAASVGTQMNQTINMSAGNYGATMRAMAMNTTAYAASGAAMAFSDADRKRAAGIK